MFDREELKGCLMQPEGQDPKSDEAFIERLRIIRNQRRSLQAFWIGFALFLAAIGILFFIKIQTWLEGRTLNGFIAGIVLGMVLGLFLQQTVHKVVNGICQKSVNRVHDMLIKYYDLYQQNRQGGGDQDEVFPRK